MFRLGNLIPLYLFSQCLLFIHLYISINDFIFIYLSHSLQHVLASNVQGRSEVEASPLQLKYKLIIMLLYRKWDNKMCINKMLKMLQCSSDIDSYKLIIMLLCQRWGMCVNKMLKMLQCPGDVDGYVDYSHYSCFMSLGQCNILTILLIYFVLSHCWYNNIIISSYFKGKGGASTSVLLLILL